MLFATELRLYMHRTLRVVIVIPSDFITQLRSWDFIFIPRGLTVLEEV